MYSIDLGINCCGTSSIVFEGGKIHLNKMLTYKSQSDDAPEKIEEVGDYIVKVIETIKPTIVFLEKPTGALIYGAGKRAYLVKRADNVCKVRCLYSYIRGRHKGKTKSKLIPIEPNQWQDKKDIKNYNDSKDWSVAKALEIITKLAHKDKQEDMLKALDEHNADALVMAYTTLYKSLSC